jgi:hypothetical protein
MTETVLRSELKSIIDDMPERSLYALKPLLSVLAIDPVIIETDLTAEEKAIIEAGEKEYREYPETFVPLESIRQGEI